MAASSSTLEDYTRGKPTDALALLERFMHAARECGPLEVECTRDRVVLHGSRRIFASVRCAKEGLRGHLNLLHRVDDARFPRVEALTKRILFHRFVISSASELDDEFLGWIREAYAVGQGRPHE